MKLDARRLVVSVAFVASVAIAASPALGDGPRTGQRDGQSDGRHNGQVTPHTPQPSSPFTRIYAPLPYNPRPVVQRPFVPSTFGNSVIVVPSPVAPPYPPPLPYGSGYGYDPSAGVSPGEMYGQPDGMPIPPPPSGTPTQSVIQYPNGRYELRGDGWTSPYTWAWIPHAPPPPPAAPPVTPPVTTRQSSGSEDFYSFVDDQGVLHWTDRWDSIPDKYRSNAKRLPL
jgi:hypothetical protein